MRIMSTLSSIFKSEVSRLARKELRKEFDQLRKMVSSQRSEIASLKRRLDVLERQASQTQKTISKFVAAEPEPDAANIRFRADGFKSHRERLELSAREVGLLIGASQLSVYKWEQGRSRPGASHLAAIARLRKMGKREAHKKLSELTS